MSYKIEKASWGMTLIGLAIVGGGYFIGGALRTGAFGFGLAFIVLGLFDMLRPKVNE